MSKMKKEKKKREGKDLAETKLLCLLCGYAMVCIAPYDSAVYKVKSWTREGGCFERLAGTCPIVF